jgi:hypothetical protein
MKKYLKAEYVTNGKLPAIEAKLAEYAASDKWGSSRSCFGCLLCFLGFFVMGPIAPILGVLVYLYYSRYDTEDRRYQLPTQLLQALSGKLDAQKDMLLRVDFRESLADPFITAKSDSAPKMREYAHNWLELQMYTQRGQRLCVKITRVGREVVTGSGKSESKQHTYAEVAAMSLENFDKGNREASALALPDSAKFTSLIGGTTGAAVAMQVVGAQQGVGYSGVTAFDGTDLATYFEFALNQ